MIAWLTTGGGRGHATRAAAVCRRMKAEIRVIVSAGFNDQLDRAGVPYRISTGSGFEIVQLWQPDLVVVDQSDLYDFDCPTVFVSRLARPMLKNHVAVINAEQPMPWALPEEMLDRQKARDHLGAVTDLPLCVFVPSAVPGVTPQAKDGFETVVAPDESASIWLQGADHVIGVPGCNLHWEVTGAGVPATWLLPEGHLTDMALRYAQPIPQWPRGPLTTESVEEAARLLDSLV